MNRHLSRIVSMQSLFEIDFRQLSDVDQVISRNINEYKGKVDEEFIRNLVRNVLKNEKLIDKSISKAAPEWPIDQIPLIDKAILRVSTYEIMYSKEIPKKVSINEAVELAKQFGSENSSKFINGVLGTIFTKSEKANKQSHKEKK